MQDVTKSVQGIAVYAEFARSNATTQVIVTPDGYGEDGQIIRSNIVRRTITSTSPRKQWRFSMIPERKSVPSEDKAVYANSRMEYATSLFDQLLSGGWQIVGKPILLETSKSDLVAIRNSKTPTKMIYRINQCRDVLGYPADLVNETVPAIV
jgi:hypothetical protein